MKILKQALTSIAHPTIFPKSEKENRIVPVSIE
jgi:hypothetical protein